MNGVPNTTVEILRGQETDPYGDEADLDLVVASGILAAVHEDRQVAGTQAQDRQQQIGYFTLWVKHGVDLRIDDRVRDERTGYVYTVNDVTSPPSSARLVDVRCGMRRVAGS
jgi:hypothetical protein